MLMLIKSCLSPLPPYAKLDECFIKLLLFQHQERQTNCSHIMSLPPEIHMLVINVKDLLLILGFKQYYILVFMFDFNLQRLSGLKSNFAFSLASCWLSATHALWSASAPTKTATRKRTAIPQWFPVSIYNSILDMEPRLRRTKVMSNKLSARTCLNNLPRIVSILCWLIL